MASSANTALSPPPYAADAEDDDIHASYLAYMTGGKSPPPSSGDAFLSPRSSGKKKKKNNAARRGLAPPSVPSPPSLSRSLPFPSPASLKRFHAFRRRFAESLRTWRETDDTLYSVLRGARDVRSRMPRILAVLSGDGEAGRMTREDVEGALVHDLSTMERYYGYLRTHGRRMGGDADAAGRRCDDVVRAFHEEIFPYFEVLEEEEEGEGDGEGREETEILRKKLRDLERGMEDVVAAYKAMGTELYRKQCLLDQVLMGEEDEREGGKEVNEAEEKWPMTERGDIAAFDRVLEAG